MVIGIDASRANSCYKTGPGWYSYYLIKEFAKIDKENQYILYVNELLTDGLADLTSENPDDIRPEAHFDKQGYQIIKSPYNNFKAKILGWPFYFFWTQGGLSLEMLLNMPDLLFVPAHAIPVLHPKLTVNTIHDIGFEIDRKYYKSEILGPENVHGRKFINYIVKLLSWGKYGANTRDYLSWSTKYSLKHSKLVITPSQFTKNELLRVYGAKNANCQVISNGYNADLYKRIEDRSAVDKVLDEYGITRPYILYVGRLERKKNTHDLVQAFGILKQKYRNFNHKLVLVGQASFGYDEVNYMMHEYGIGESVIIPGWISEVQMPHIYSGADAFIYPSFYEGFGIPLLQAMACGLPVAASNASAIPEVAGDAAYYFDPSDVHEISAAIHRIVTDRDLREDLAKKGHERVKGFSWKRCARQTLELFKELAQKE
jgi:glycosyltransferase involved in cell wall biosynthesis